MRRACPPGSRVVVKVGSSSLAHAGGGLDRDALAMVVGQVGELWNQDHPTVLVSSGAVAAGLPAMGLKERPVDLPGLQAAAAVGQGKLMEHYAAEFGARQRVVGQVLLTRDILAQRSQYLHAGETLERLLEIGAVPIVNENDSVVVDELKLGDNDRLAAIVSHLVSASMLVILTDTNGLYTDDPRRIDDAEMLAAVRHTDEILDELHRRSGAGAIGSGGVATKVSAARMAASSGIPTVIADASEPDAAVAAVAGAEVGTWVEPFGSKLPARKLWIAFGLQAEGRLTIDAGATGALTSGGSSLLAVGILDVAGSFDPGSAVEVVAVDGSLLGKGLTRLSSADIQRVRGEHSSVAGGEVIHRDDLVMLA